jgi:hypothetical protein
VGSVRERVRGERGERRVRVRVRGEEKRAEV